MAHKEGKRQETQAQQGGEHSASVADLFRAHNHALVRFLALRLQSVQEAKEVAQEAYVRLLQLDRPAVQSFMRAYLFRIAANLAVDRLRRRGTEQRAVEATLFEDMDVSTEPERRAIAAQQLALVRICLDELPEARRRAFLLHRVHGRSVAEIATELGVTGRMVRHHLERTLVYCQLRLDGATADEARKRMKR